MKAQQNSVFHTESDTATGWAADLRNSCAHNNLGLCSGMARGVDRDFEEAFKYYKKAAGCYDKGTGVEMECTELPKKDADRLS
ncbi:hypothetical protein M9Y10_025685 [Tritrichomonas musculus]|uniref:Beta-lactamase n=1 Tax=Tritrichomonas musculus TaxID=1915356 RepID=A0ABR2H9E2_9EUKA